MNLARSIILSRFIHIADWVVAAVRKHVIAKDTLAGRCECVGIDESTDSGVVIPGLQVVQASVLGADMAIGVILALLPLVFKRKPGAFCVIVVRE